MTFSGSATSPRQFPRDGLPEVAFLGRSNVGKSSLLNALAGVRGLARVSSDPGRFEPRLDARQSIERSVQAWRIRPFEHSAERQRFADDRLDSVVAERREIRSTDDEVGV